MTDLSAGPVTFLFTDIERSTESAAAIGDHLYAELLQTHRTLLRDALEALGGQEFATEGDALFFAFIRARDSIRAAVAGQLALDEHDWPAEMVIRVRMGLHTGEAVISQGEYVGHNVHKAKRICDAGHGGQILLSESTATLVEADLDETTALADLGRHRLKDLGEPQRLYQLETEGLPREFPALRSLESFIHNLPAQRSTFIGREHELTGVHKLLETQRLVTLTGIGGCGKTRLALQVGAEQLDRFPDGVFFIELAVLSDPELIARGVADAIGMVIGGSMTGGTSVPVEDLVIDHLRRKQALLILDNCEHMLGASAGLVDRVLSECPNVSIIATTREALDVEGEQSWPVPSLSLPHEDDDPESSEAVSLFDARARAVQPTFELGPENLEPVTEICRRVDGLPLAIELAASRVTHLTPHQIAARLDDMFRLLTGGRRRIQRQQTLEASLDWSYELLSDTERVLLRRLAVFAGPFPLDAAEEICANGGIERDTVFELLGSLVDKSLVGTVQAGTEIRYRLLEPVRLYAAEHLRQADEAEAFRERHRDRYIEWVESFPLEEATFGFAAFRAFEAELGNLRVALEWSAGEGRYDLVARLTNRLITLWWNGGHFDEAHRWFTTVTQNAEDLSVDELVATYAGLTASSVMRVDGDARHHATAAIQEAAGEPIPHLVLARSLGSIFSGVVAEVSRDPSIADETREWIRQAIALGEEVGPAWKSFALGVAGQVELILHDITAADRYLTESLETWDVPSIGMVGCSSALAVARHILGDAQGAVVAARGGAQVEAEWWRPGLGANSLGLALAGVGDFREAERFLTTSIRNATSWGVSIWLNEALLFCGASAFLSGDAARASRLFSAGRHLGGAPQMATPFRSGHSYALYLHYIPRIRDALGPGAAHRTRAEGRSMSVDDITAYALEGLSG
ncbi:MAG: ATP-binding protein [Actinomycetota bacterium]